MYSLKGKTEMKNSAVRAMAVKQFELEGEPVQVKFIIATPDGYEFEVSYMKDYKFTRKRITIKVETILELE